MENSYGIGVQNRYGMFIDDEADPFEMIKKPAAAPKGSEEKENKKGKTVAKKAPKTDVNGKSDKTNGVAKPQTQSRNGENRVKFSDHEERNNRRNRNDGPRGNNGTVGQRFDGEERPRRRFDKKFDDDGNQRRFNDGGAPRRFNDGERRFDGEGRGGRGRGMGRGGRGGRGGRRDFDRHSGSERSGIKSVDKREGSGSYNWGSAKDNMDENMPEQPAEGDAPEDKEKSADDKEGSDKDTDTEKEKEPEEPKEMTLDEYKAMQQASRVKPEYNTRKAGEGENNSQWKKTYVLKKKVEESSEEESESEEEFDESHGKKKVLLNIDFQFSDSPMRGGRGRGRGGRGGPGGRGGRGEGRAGRGGPGGPSSGGRGGGGPGGYARGGRKQEAPKMDSEGDFPSLSGRK